MAQDSAGKSSVRLPGVSIAGEHRTDRAQNMPPAPSSRMAQSHLNAARKATSITRSTIPRKKIAARETARTRICIGRGWVRNQARAVATKTAALWMTTRTIHLAGPGSVGLTVRNR